MYYPEKSKIHGMGLFASRTIKAGEIIGKLKCKPTQKDGPHVLWLDEGKAVKVSCDLRYINHSGEPNAAYYNDLTVVALRDIDAHEEIFHDYGQDWE
ncbi:hypothetical protein BOW53_01675 [Solemya pervernicosa gill symbiont]|uniref:SET domain-containing protein n=2 Tax=Gammaproteobacteria incertae sedis TaxID=118884 RepID=A0A1T2LAD4_9GAMM|nr:SET domain-containing protein [Candidatus Reidiella endopervernicosa]OOZ42067.1 hypothetical protein BOW53_01675 [Solemya pervernicosa gill symbiont]QKQ26980.1 SET domain-containing protein-lysine N-methyltransferase [Candidatus Reidiella endopervernicosa]